MKKLNYLYSATLLALSFASMATEPSDAQSGPVASSASSRDCDPYNNFDCLNDYLGTGFWERVTNYYKLEWARRRTGRPEGACIAAGGLARRRADDAADAFHRMALRRRDVARRDASGFCR